MNTLTNYKKKVPQPITCLEDPKTNEKHRDHKSIFDLLAAEFIVDNSAQLFKRRNRKAIETISKYCSTSYPPSPFTNVSEEEVSKAISDTKNSDSFFDLNIPIICLKKASPVFSAQLANLFTQIVTKSCVHHSV